MNYSTYYFAWAGSAETTFNSGHLREDELIFSFKLLQEEGQFATLEMEIRNPRMGLLNTSRPIWAWFSWSDGAGTYPLFHGRLIGIPSDLLAEIVTIKLVAKPIDYVDQRAAVAASLKVLPYFDPIFVDADHQDDPDTVLEGYSRLWHVDRSSGLVTTSDLIVGEDGLDEFGPSDVFYDSVKVELGEAPLIEVDVAASVKWTQTGGGVIDFGSRVLSTYTSGLDGDWPKAGQELSGGYRVVSSKALEWGSSKTEVNINFSYQNASQTKNDGDVESVQESWSGSIAGGRGAGPGASNLRRTMQIGDAENGVAAAGTVDVDTIGVRTFYYSVSLVLGLSMEQARTEHMKFKVQANLQPILTEPDEKSIVETLSFDVADTVLAGAGDSTAGGYFATARGQLSLEHMILVARAHLLAKARVVKITWDCAFPRIINMSCRKNASLEDRRLPGGVAVGKVTSYEMDGNGDSGEFLGHVTINSAIGYGNSVSTQAGTPDYVDAGYVDVGYQHYSGTLVVADTGDITFPQLSFPSVGLQNPLSAGQLVVRAEWNDTSVLTASSEAMQTAIQAALKQMRDQAQPPRWTTDPPNLVDHAAAIESAVNGIKQAAEDAPSWLEIELRPIQGVDAESEYDLDLGMLVVPMQIDLSAASTPGG